MRKRGIITTAIVLIAIFTLGVSFTGQLVKEQLVYFIEGKPGSYIDIPTVLCQHFNSNRVIIVEDDETIQSAIDTIIARGDNTEDSAYVILVAPGIYAETIDLDGLELYNLSLIAMAGTRTVIIDPASGRALESDTLNENLHYLYVYGFTFKDNIALSGAIDNSQFLRDYCVFEECVQTSDADSLILTNFGRFKWYNGELNICNFIDVENVYTVEFGGTRYYDMPPFTGAPGVTKITANVTNNTPYDMKDANGGGDIMSYSIRNAFCQRQEPTITSTNGHARYRVYQSYAGFNGTLTIGANSQLYLYNSTINSAVACAAGSVVRLHNSAIVKTYTSSSTDSKYYGSTEGEGVNAIAD